MSVFICGEARRLRIIYDAGDKCFHGYADSLDGPNADDLLDRSSADPACGRGRDSDWANQLSFQTLKSHLASVCPQTEHLTRRRASTPADVYGLGSGIG